MRRRLALAAVVPAAALTGTAQAAPARTPDWAAPQIRQVVTRGLMSPSVADFRPTDALTRQDLATLAFRLQLALTPPAAPPEAPAPTVAEPAEPDPATTTDATQTEPAQTTETPPADTDPSTTTAATTATAPAPIQAPPSPPTVSNPSSTVTMAGLDARFVSLLGLSDAAAAFARGARAAGLAVPARFGTEVAARLLGLRTNHPAAQDFLELRPSDPATRAEAAYSAAQALGFGWLGNSWQTAAVRSLADSFALPQLTDWQRRILDTAVARIGMPYVWGGTSDGAEAPFGVRARGGYDCSGFVWRVYKLQRYPDEGDLGATLRGRTTFQMSVEVPRSQRIPFAKLEPADVIFFGDRGPRSSGEQVGHMGIYLGDGWFIHSSGYGVALATLSGWYRHEFAWARRPLQEAGLTG